MLAGSLHLKHKTISSITSPETTIVQDGIAEAEDALRRVAQMLRTPWRRPGTAQRTHSPTVSSASERTFPQSSSRRSETLCALKVANNSSPMPDSIRAKTKAAHRSRTTPQLRNAVSSLFCVAHSSSPHHVAQRYDPDLKAYYEKKRAEGKPYSPATVCERAAHRIGAFSRYLKRGTPYVKRELV